MGPHRPACLLPSRCQLSCPPACMRTFGVAGRARRRAPAQPGLLERSYAYEWAWRPGALPRVSLVPPGAARHKLPRSSGARRAYDRVETQPGLHTFGDDLSGASLPARAEGYQTPRLFLCRGVEGCKGRQREESCGVMQASWLQGRCISALELTYTTYTPASRGLSSYERLHTYWCGKTSHCISRCQLHQTAEEPQLP